MSSCDARVSSSLEGIGLTIAEAMGLGKPVIATGWSGNTMDVSNAFPVGYRLVEIAENVGPCGRSVGRAIGRAGCRADALCRRSPDEARVRGGAARETIQRDYSETRIAEMVRQRLAIIGERHQFDEFKQDVKALVAAYRDLVRDIRDVVGRVVPAGGNVMVVSKGDNNLLQFEGRTGFHFPETGTGVYAGYHPATALPRSRRWTRESTGGASTPFSWHVAVVARSLRRVPAHLDARYPRLWSDPAVRALRRAPAWRSGGARMSTVLVASVIATKCETAATRARPELGSRTQTTRRADVLRRADRLAALHRRPRPDGALRRARTSPTSSTSCARPG